MNHLVALAYFHVVTLVFGLAGFACLRSFGLRVGEAWGGGRLMGMIVAAYPAWWAGSLGFSGWPLVGRVVLIGGAVAGLIKLLRTPGVLHAAAGPECMFLLVSGLMLLFRLPNAAILGTEKPMDFGILMSLDRAPGFPPPDMWRAGESLPYYYWGYLPWILPMDLSGLPPGQAYNLIVAALAGQTFLLASALGSRLSGGTGAGPISGFLAVWAGTPDGAWQLAARHSLADLDLWRSSRQVPDTITEFPLFSFWLGDLHPHLLSLPLLLLALLVALVAQVHGHLPRTLVALALLTGLAGSANPWSFPTIVLAVGLLLTLPGTGRPFTRRLGTIALLAPGSLLATAPFWYSHVTPYGTVAGVRTWTALPDLLLYGGVVLIPALGAAYASLYQWGGKGTRGSLMAMCVCAGFLLGAGMLDRPTLVLLAGLFGVLLIECWRDPCQVRNERPALMLAALGTGLFLVPEILHLADGYGDRLHRMNTVFKSYFQAWALLAVSWPGLLAVWLPDLRLRRRVSASLLALTLPHLLAVPAKGWGTLRDLDGLAWMTAGDRAAVEFLRRQPPGTTLVEAVGEAYSRYGRISAASGVPAYLGWRNHEGVWRGDGWRPMLEARNQAVSELYASGDARVIQRRLREIRPTYIVVGPLERNRYPASALNALRAEASVVFEHQDTALLSFGDDR